MTITPEEMQEIKDIIEIEIMRDFNNNRLHPYSRHKHLLEHIFWKLDKLEKPA